MGSYNNMVITSVGQALLTSVLGTQGTLTFSKFQTSSYQYSGGTDLSALTSLNSVQQEVTPSSAGVIDANNLYVSSSVDNDSLATGYTAYTLGIFATDGNSEVLFGVSTAVTPDVIPADTGGTPSTYTYRMQLKVSSTDNIDINIEPGAYALAEDLETEAEERAEADFKIIYGLCNKTTAIATVSGNKQITESGEGVTAVTVIVKTSETVKTITATVTPEEGDYIYTQTTVITKTEGGKTIQESYTRSPKPQQA
jgi:hypothetical protein